MPHWPQKTAKTTTEEQQRRWCWWRQGEGAGHKDECCRRIIGALAERNQQLGCGCVPAAHTVFCLYSLLCWLPCLPSVLPFLPSWPANAVDVIVVVIVRCWLILHAALLLTYVQLAPSLSLRLVILLIDNCGNAWNCWKSPIDRRKLCNIYQAGRQLNGQIGGHWPHSM